MTTGKQAGVPVSVAGLSKAYGSALAVDNVSIEVEGGEFLALLGPSGSGKSTILMTIAGFEQPTRGDIRIGGVTVTALPPHRREIGMVFQRYALFPHLTVAENVAYPLRRRGVDGDRVKQEVGRALDLICLQGYGNRYPAQLSGGQQQRVALARALVFRPPVLLMDEPLGALDRKLRQQMQMEIKLLHRELGTTIIFVTHDQEEALSMANRIAVLHQGKLEQIGSPQELYDRPVNAFVAGFIGETNFLPVELRETSEGRATVAVEGSSLTVSVTTECLCTERKQAMLAVRPEHLRLVDDQGGIPATVVETAYAGSSLSVLMKTGTGRLVARMPLTERQQGLSAGDEVRVMPMVQKCRVYDRDNAALASA